MPPLPVPWLNFLLALLAAVLVLLRELHGLPGAS